MSLLLFGEPNNSCIMDSHFGFDEPEAFFSPLNEIQNLLRYCPVGNLRPWRTHASGDHSKSTIAFEKDQFRANLDVQHFKPDEISVKIADNVVTVEGKHEEKKDEHGFISRQFVRKYVLPEGHDVGRIESRLSSDGILTITAPKIQENPTDNRSIPVIQTEKPFKAVESKPAAEEKME